MCACSSRRLRPSNSTTWAWSPTRIRGSSARHFPDRPSELEACPNYLEASDQDLRVGSTPPQDLEVRDEGCAESSLPLSGLGGLISVFHAATEALAVPAGFESAGLALAAPVASGGAAATAGGGAAGESSAGAASASAEGSGSASTAGGGSGSAAGGTAGAAGAACLGW